MDCIERMGYGGFQHWSRARLRERGRTPGLRLEWLEGRVMLSGSPSLQGTFVAAGILTIGGSLFQDNSGQGGGAILSGGGTVKLPDFATPSIPALSAGGEVGTTTSSATSSAGNATSTAGNAASTAGNATTTSSPGTTTNAASGSSSSSTAGESPSSPAS